ncbi:hypothetical protein BDN72DRAFT_858844 [Pluteus cervinus]|uniref:Uncharacterized protein n=1 Tax=Pluteus cervinus TaxID=181527 RepID=A0ACD3AQ85_9AGAR|nr:hypothetical protein BDN72DRAFT_858844 [Pluteus cervinus]
MSDPNSHQATDLRHVQSNAGLTTPSRDHRDRSNRVSQHLRTSEARLGSRSPNSIPSSPTSVHSSSSAIFERDIEPIVSSSSPSSHPHHPHHPPNPHRIPRSKTTEQIEQAVPSVLDSAASILASLEDADSSEIAVLTPATTPFDSILSRSGGSGFASPIGSFRSRSPSPVGSRSTGAPGILLSLPNATSPRPLIQSEPLVQTPTSRQGTADSFNLALPTDHTVTPSIITPTTAYFTTPDSSPRDIPTQPIPTSNSVASSPGDITQPLSISNSSPSSTPLILGSSSPTAAATAAILAASVAATATINPHGTSSTSSHPPSPHHPPTKRLSFMSYSDLLSSTPSSTLPLSSLTTSASSNEPPPHIPSVSGFVHTQTQAQQVGSAAASVRGLMLGGGSERSPSGTFGMGTGRVSPGIFGGGGQRDSIVMVDDVGGEWEREGLGRGLEERLEALMPTVPTAVGTRV